MQDEESITGLELFKCRAGILVKMSRRREGSVQRDVMETEIFNVVQSVRVRLWMKTEELKWRKPREEKIQRPERAIVHSYSLICSS